MSKVTGSKLSRRHAVKRLVALGIGAGFGWSTAKSQAVAEVKVGALKDFPEVYSTVRFSYGGIASLAVRLPRSAANPRLLEVSAQDGMYLSAYRLVCPHGGCELRLPNQDHILVCPCHASTFGADGRRLSGPAGMALGSIRLELRQNEIFALGSA